MFSHSFFLLLNLLFIVKSENNFCDVGKPPVFEYPGPRGNGDYDYVVVGAGASGSVVANRLSEDPSIKVLLLEAGGTPPATNEIPLCMYEVRRQLENDWGYYIQPQKNACLDTKDQQPLFSQYKALGGCTSHNGMVYTRGNRKDYDEWAELGAEGWNYDNILPLFKKSEDNVINKNYIQSDYHGKGGLLTVSAATYESELRDAYFEAGKSLGLKEVDYNGESQTGFSHIQVTQRGGHRCGTEKAFLRSAADRPNLDILTYARVTKIEFDDSSDGTKRASRVVYDLKNETSLKVGARKEIILSAGALNTPHLLLLSGVGPKEDLEKLGIPVIADLPVGRNFHDHVFPALDAWSLNTSVGILLSRAMTKEVSDEFKEGKGLLTSPDTMENVFFINTKYNKDIERPDIQILTRASVDYNVPPKQSAGLSAFLDNTDTTVIGAFLLKPKSRGFVKLNSTDPYEQPIVDPNYFAEEQDLLTVVEGMKFARQLIASPSLQKYGPKPVREFAPNCNATAEDWDSDENLICIARHTTAPGIHAGGTARMGNPKDDTTVVDPRLRVKGVTGLRVADASIMPVVISGNTMVPSIMIGEKAAIMIAEDREQ